MNICKKIAIGTAIVLISIIGMIVYFSGFHLDFSQNYRRIDGYENIVFKDSRNDQCFRLCTWGLVKTENSEGFEEHHNPDRTSYEYQLIVENTDAGECDIGQVVPSPDGKYILYIENIYRGTGVTDDEDVYYKVYSIEDETSITIYSGYRQYFLVDWL
jgi:hypothetical protein